MHFLLNVILLLVVPLLIVLLWKLRNFMNLYVEFPAYPMIPNIVIASVLRKIPLHIPFHGFFFQMAMKASKQFQEEGMFLAWLLKPHLFIYDEEGVKTFSNEQEALNKPYKYDILRDIFGSGLLTSNSEDWKKQRKLLNPVFHLGILKNKLPIFNDNAEILVDKLSELKDCSSIDILEYLKPCAFGNICEYILGLKMNSPENKELIKNYAKMISNLAQMEVYRFGNPWFYYKFMLNFIPSGRTYLKQLNQLHSFTREIVSAVKENIIFDELNKIKTDYESDDEKLTRKSFVHILLEQKLKDPSFTMGDVHDQITTFMATGYESVAFTAMWCLFMLGHHPEVQNRMYNEIRTISEGYIHYEDIVKLNYMDCVIKETLRLYPTAPVYARQIGKDIQYGKYKVPKDTTIVFFLYRLHRNPKIYLDPEKFKPERFMDGNLQNLPWNFTPFSEGIRYCIGKKFAMMELKVVLTHILRHFQITSLDRIEDVELCWEIVLSPVKPLRFKLTPRK